MLVTTASDIQESSSEINYDDKSLTENINEEPATSNPSVLEIPAAVITKKFVNETASCNKVDNLEEESDKKCNGDQNNLSIKCSEGESINQSNMPSKVSGAGDLAESSRTLHSSSPVQEKAGNFIILLW